MCVPPRLPVVVVPSHLCSVNANSAVARAVHGPHTGTAQLRLCKPFYTPGHPGVRTRDMTYRRMEMRTPRSKCKLQYRWDMYFSLPTVAVLAPPTLAAAALPRGTTHSGVLLEQHTAGLPRTPGALPQIPRTHYALHVSAHIAPAQPKRGIMRDAKSRAKSGDDWTGLDGIFSHGSATVVYLGSSSRRSRGRSRTRALHASTDSSQSGGIRAPR